MGTLGGYGFDWRVWIRGDVLGGDQTPTAWRKELDGWVVRISLRTITNVISVIPMFFPLVSAWITTKRLLAYFLGTAKYHCELAHIDSSTEEVGAHVGDYQSLLFGCGLQLRGDLGEFDSIHCLPKG